MPDVRHDGTCVPPTRSDVKRLNRKGGLRPAAGPGRWRMG
ncbi:hypothetical protein HMPREF0551_0347 [Lautropia mirabilis ATCC 51599]|uniref:Uncharacterized protein n=1 Tax=Lautropia mirabilis ATCC 51599 TaxID=887898 RepID=E7RTS8_9BURK|nr:hypothetical protein HMPREF0551_0347 [Lautropia mirabilis ATCC 51599]